MMDELNTYMILTIKCSVKDNFICDIPGLTPDLRHIQSRMLLCLGLQQKVAVTLKGELLRGAAVLGFPMLLQVMGDSLLYFQLPHPHPKMGKQTIQMKKLHLLELGCK